MALCLYAIVNFNIHVDIFIAGKNIFHLNDAPKAHTIINIKLEI